MHKRLTKEEIHTGIAVAYPIYIPCRGSEQFFRYPAWVIGTIKKTSPKKRDLMFENGVIRQFADGVYAVDEEMVRETIVAESFRDLQRHADIVKKFCSNMGDMGDISDMDIMEVCEAMNVIVGVASENHDGCATHFRD